MSTRGNWSSGMVSTAVGTPLVRPITITPPLGRPRWRLSTIYSGRAKKVLVNPRGVSQTDANTFFLTAARAIARGARLLRRRSQRKKRLRSLLLGTAARDFPTL